MSVLIGPKFVNDSMVFYVDASVSKSYPGTGSIWYDLAGSSNLTSGGTQTPYTTISTVPCFQFNDSGYWQGTAADGMSFYMGDGSTLEMWYYTLGIVERDTIFEKSAYFSGASYQNELACTIETNGGAGIDHTMSFYRKGHSEGTYDYANAGPLVVNKWNHIVVRLEPGTGGGNGVLNNVPISWGYTIRSNVAAQQAANVTIGTGYAGVVESGYISIVRVYDKQLTNDEVSLNYNWFKAKYPSAVVA